MADDCLSIYTRNQHLSAFPVGFPPGLRFHLDPVTLPRAIGRVFALANDAFNALLLTLGQQPLGIVKVSEKRTYPLSKRSNILSSLARLAVNGSGLLSRLLCRSRSKAQQQMSSGLAPRPWRAMKSGMPLALQATASASMMRVFVGRCLRAWAIAGNRDVKSTPIAGVDRNVDAFGPVSLTPLNF